MAQFLTVATKRKKQVLDITDTVQEYLDKLQHDEHMQTATGLCHVFVLHTTAAMTTADLDPGTDLDMLDAFESMVPHLKYRHPHNPEHVPDHIMSSIIGPDVLVPVEEGELKLGTWQRIVLIELDGPRSRNVALSFISTRRTEQ